ncbi:MAG: beta-lactamase family protein [Clostridia bacterium]|nr:beta-lactamase family protein [Clostridia bacterium]
MFSETKNFLDSFLDMGMPGFDCLVYYKGKEVLRYFGGYSDTENKILVNGNEKYNIYSCSKPITCTAALQLYEKGIISLDDKLSDYIKEFENMFVKCEDGTLIPVKNPITIKHLFTMTAGFNYDLNSPSLSLARKETKGRCPTVETVKYLAREPLCFEPGDRYMYSLCHDVLAAVVEVASTMAFEEYVKKNIFDVLGMSSSGYHVAPEHESEFAQQYTYDSNEKLMKIKGRLACGYRLGTQYASGGAGMVSTVEDYMKFLEAMRVGDIILKSETINLMSSAHISEYQRRTFDLEPTNSYTYGLGVRTPRDRSKLTEFGWDGAAASYLSCDREKGLCIFLAQHVLNAPNFYTKNSIRSFVAKDLGIE